MPDFQLQRPIRTVPLALIHNPNSRRNHYDGDAFVKVAREMLGEFCVCSQHDEYLVDHVRRLEEKGVDVIVLNGGDGTVSACLTAVAAVYPKGKLPDIVVLPSGNTNLIAGDVGFGMRGPEALKYLVAGQGLRISERAPICLSWPDEDRPDVLGMFGGCTGYARAVRIAHSPTILKFAPHDFAVFLTILTSVASLLFRCSRQKWLNGNSMRWVAQSENGSLEREGRSFLFLATSLERLSHGIWPFWNEGKGEKGFHFLDVHAFPAQLSSAIVVLLCGYAPSWLRRHKDYTSHIVERMELETNSDFVLDGEVFAPSQSSRILLERGPVFRFLHK